MRMNSETKVGILTVVALILFIFTSLFVSNSPLIQRGRIAEARFSRIEGLQPGAPVKLAGLDIGRVTKIYFDGQEVIVRMRIYNRDDVVIGEKSKVIITSASVLGDKYLEIVLKPGDKPLKKGARLKGESPITMDQFMIIAYDTMTSLSDITEALKIIIGDDKLKDNLKDTMARLDRITVSVEQITHKINQFDFASINKHMVSILNNMDSIIIESRGDIREILLEMKSVMADAHETTQIVKKFAGDLSRDGETAKQLQETMALALQLMKTTNELMALLNKESPEMISDIKETVHSLKEASAKLNNMLERISRYTTEENMENLESSLRDTAEVVHKANEVISQYQTLNFSAQFEAAYDKTTETVSSTLGLTVKNDKKSFTTFGISDLGGENELNLQFGRSWKGLSGSFGIIRNEFGIGVSGSLFSNLSIGADLYNPINPQIDVYSLLYLGRSDFFMRYKFSDVTNRDLTMPSLSLGYKF